MQYEAGVQTILADSDDPLNCALNTMLSHYLSQIIPNIMRCPLESNTALLLLLSSIVESSNKPDYCLKLIEKNLDAIKAKQAQIPIPKTYSLFGGFTDIAFSLHAIAPFNEQWNTNDIKVNAKLAESTIEYIDYIENNAVPLLPNICDCINGLSGALGYFLLYDNSASILASKRILSCLIKVFSSPNAWHAPPQCFFLHTDNLPPCDSVVSLGLAHGVAGVLAALSLSEKKGLSISGQKEVMNSLCKDYLLDSLRKEADILYWPSMLFYDSANREIFRLPTKKMSWCHGSLGILRAIQLYAQSMRMTSLEDWVFDRFNVITGIPFETLNLDSPIFCHGIAGLLTTLHAMSYGQDHKIPMECLDLYGKKILDSYKPKSRYGFDSTDYIRNSTHSIIKVQKNDGTTLLSGTPGIILALLSWKKKNPLFERHFLLG